MPIPEQAGLPPSGMFLGLWQQPGFYKFIAFLSFAAFIKMIFLHMDYTYPKFGIRELGGFPMKQNDLVMIFLPGADLDPREFPNPEVFDIKRENNVHIAFGAGVHRCLGSHLARVELQVIYEQMLARLPEFRLDETKPAKFHAGNIIAIDSLSIRWD